MNRKIFLSIIIPVFNNLNHVLDLLKSADISNSKNIEVIIIDDGSKPKLKKKLNKFKLKYKYIKNLGPSYARNFGAKISSGKFLLFLDSDLVLPNNFLKRLINLLKKEKIKIATIPYGIKSNIDNIFSQYKAFFDYFNVCLKLKGLKETGYIIGSSCVFSRKIFFKSKGWNQNIKTPSIEHEEFSRRLKKIKITRLKNFYVEHKFPSGIKLFKKIFLRSRDWVFSKLSGTIEFSGLTTTKTSGFFSLQPLLFFILLVSFFLNENLSTFILIIPLFFFIFGNFNFFYFLYQKTRLNDLIKYIFIHFFFNFFVSLGALVGLFKYSFYRIFN
jgi:glycosyltransferase involved in cell wall biosynthesis